jgi:hypothetical protein
LAQLPTISAPAARPQAQTGSKSAPAPLVPFTRAARKMSRLIGQWPLAAGASVLPFAPVQLPAAGFLRFLRLTVTGTTAGNAAAVAFNADAPFNALQQISILTANGDALTSPLDGFSLYLLNKYGAFGTGRKDPVSDPAYSVTTGAGATGGSFKFQIVIPFEVDTRDAFCSLENMAANQSYLLQMSLSPTSQIYTTAPTNAPTVTVRAVMEYWAAPSATTTQGIGQQTAPNGDGSVSLIQTQQPPIVPSTNQSIQLVNVGNTIRSMMFVLRTAAGARTDADWPDVTTFYQNGQPLMLKTKDNWRSQMSQDYSITGGVSATPALNTLDQGVYVVTDFMNDGGSGNARADGGANRDLLLVTGSGTALNIEATSNWGAAASSLLAIQNAIRPASPSALYSPFVN